MNHNAGLAKKIRIHGVLVLVEAFVANMLAAAVLSHISWNWTIGYLLVCAVGSVSILYAYCAKCPCRENCLHVIPGKIAVACTHRKTAPYSFYEIGVVAVAFAMMYALPLLWLWQHLSVLLPYALLLGFALLQVQTMLCCNCSNHYCPARKVRSQIPK